MCPNLQFPANLVIFTEEILNGQLCAVILSPETHQKAITSKHLIMVQIDLQKDQTSLIHNT